MSFKKILLSLTLCLGLATTAFADHIQIWLNCDGSIHSVEIEIDGGPLVVDIWT